MAHLNGNKTKNVGWYDDDDADVDDEEFLKNSRKPPSSTGVSSHYQNQLTQLSRNREEIESRTLASSERSLSMLHESEQVGIATARELASQREQLERTTRNLDDINSTLRSTQRNIDGIKSVFTSLRNYITGPKDVPPSSSSSRPNSNNPAQPSQETIRVEPRIPTQRFESDEPVRKPANAQEAIDRNLSLMSGNITNLRGLALNLGDEILEQNELLDNMQYKADKAGNTISKQNTQINRLLGKK